MADTPVKPYLLRALFEWCNDSGFTPYLTVQVGEGVQVPLEHVRGGEIVLNISPLATNRLVIGNDEVRFQARFGGVAREVCVPIESVRAIYARENGQGMAFETPGPGPDASDVDPAANAGEAPAGPSAEPDAPVAPIPLHAVRTPAGEGAAPESASPEELPPTPPAGGGRPRLTRIK